MINLMDMNKTLVDEQKKHGLVICLRNSSQRNLRVACSIKYIKHRNYKHELCNTSISETYQIKCQTHTFTQIFASSSDLHSLQIITSKRGCGCTSVATLWQAVHWKSPFKLCTSWLITRPLLHSSPCRFCSLNILLTPSILSKSEHSSSLSRDCLEPLASFTLSKCVLQEISEFSLVTLTLIKLSNEAGWRVSKLSTVLS